MNKQEFLTDLRGALTGLPQGDIEDRTAFYEEMINDRIEEGMSEEEAVACAGTVDQIRMQALAEIPLQKLVKERIKPKRRLRTWEIVLIILGFPVWFPLIAAAGAIVLALYIIIWALIVSLWAVEVSFWACVLCGLAAAIVYFVRGEGVPALMIIGTALLLAGLSVFLFFGCIEGSKGVFRLTKKIGVSVKSAFIGKEKKK